VTKGGRRHCATVRSALKIEACPTAFKLDGRILGQAAIDASAQSSSFGEEKTLSDSMPQRGDVCNDE